MKGILQLLLVALATSQYKLVTAQNQWYPKYHIAPLQGWMNDPNGLIFHNGYYHVFWQYNPDYATWGPMHWGHARSTDMLNWEHLPIALTPSLPEDIDGIYSGSAVVKDGKITLIYTGVSENATRQRQMAAVSEDDINFEKLGVIIDRDGDELNFRDPKAWRQDNDSWFVVIGSKTPEERGETLLYKSPDFFNWTYEGPLAQADDHLGYMWECPDFFTLGEKQLLVINPQGMEQDGYDYQNLYQTGYFVGTWTPGSNYTIEKTFREIDHGHDFYASQTFLAPDGRRILIGWLSMWESQFPENTTGWSCMLTLPRELTLSDSGDLEVRPIREIQQARLEREVSTNTVISNGKMISLLDNEISSSEILVTFNLTDTTAEVFGIELKAGNFSNSTEGVKVYANRSENRLFLERYYPQYQIESSLRSVAVDLTLPELSLDVFLDRSSIEVFVNDGQAVLSSRIYPNDDQRAFYSFATGNLSLSQLSFWDI